MINKLLLMLAPGTRGVTKPRFMDLLVGAACVGAGLGLLQRYVEGVQTELGQTFLVAMRRANTMRAAQANGDTYPPAPAYPADDDLDPLRKAG